MEQIELFDLIDREGEEGIDKKRVVSPSQNAYKVNELVKVIKLKSRVNIEVEDYYYLKEFENKKGKIIECTKNKNGVYCYKVEFDKDKIGYFYKEDLILI